tara:strand:+ start:224 stop:418 length:195 start_codon:yes stop_codon:yes gene_type:complete
VKNNWRGEEFKVGRTGIKQDLAYHTKIILICLMSEETCVTSAALTHPQRKEENFQLIMITKAVG